LGGRGTLAGERGVGGVPIPTRGHTQWYSLYNSTLWVNLRFFPCIFCLPLRILFTVRFSTSSRRFFTGRDSIIFCSPICIFCSGEEEDDDDDWNIEDQDDDSEEKDDDDDDDDITENKKSDDEDEDWDSEEDDGRGGGSDSKDSDEEDGSGAWEDDDW
jgi:hypothetical protein